MPRAFTKILRCRRYFYITSVAAFANRLGEIREWDGWLPAPYAAPRTERALQAGWRRATHNAASSA